VLPIGGVKEKLLAAHRHDISTVLLPRDNEKDMDDIPGYARDTLTIKFVETMDEVLQHALERVPEPLPVRLSETGEVAEDYGAMESGQGDQDSITN